jgi:uncharacterized membrane protein
MEKQMNRISYRMPRTIAVFTAPSVVICALPHYLGMTTIKPEFEIFRSIFDGSVTGLFIGSIVYLLYAIVHNIRVEPT